jgi:hypothetical protein
VKFEESLIELRNGYKISRQGYENKWWLEKDVNKPVTTDSMLANDWVVIPEKKEPKLMAPAIICEIGSKYCKLSGCLFESEAEAKECYGNTFISWPAVPNAEGFYAVEGPT